MDSATFAKLLKETPEDRMNHLRNTLFKNGGVNANIPGSVMGPEVPERVPTPAPRETAEADFGRRVLKGTIPPKFPPARKFPQLVRRERIVMQDIPEVSPAPPPPEVVRVPSPPEVPALPVSVPVPTTPIESDDEMQKKKSATAAKPAPSQALKGSRGIPASPASAKVFDTLFSLHQKGEAITHGEYQSKYGKVDRNVFYSARQKLDRVTKAKKGPAGRGKPAQVFTPAPAAGGNGRAHVEIIYTSDSSPKAEVMEELKKVLPVMLASFAAHAGFEIDAADLEIKNFAPAGYEIRRKVR